MKMNSRKHTDYSTKKIRFEISTPSSFYCRKRLADKFSQSFKNILNRREESIKKRVNWEIFPHEKLNFWKKVYFFSKILYSWIETPGGSGQAPHLTSMIQVRKNSKIAKNKLFDDFSVVCLKTVSGMKKNDMTEQKIRKPILKL